MWLVFDKKAFDLVQEMFNELTFDSMLTNFFPFEVISAETNAWTKPPSHTFVQDSVDEPTHITCWCLGIHLFAAHAALFGQ